MKNNLFKKTAALLFLASTIAFAPPITAHAVSSEIKGIDVSGKYNGTVDWDLVAEQGYSFAMIRIAEGQAPDVDSQFEANYEGAKAAGLKVGVYHDCCIRTPEDAKKEAAYAIELLDGRELDYPVAYDIEKDGSFAGGIDNTTALAKAYCSAIEDAGYTPMIYSTASHISKDFNWEELSGIRIWVAHYEVDAPAIVGKYDLWQYTSKGNVDGANTDKGFCDLNYSFMEAEKLSLSVKELSLGVGDTYTAKATLSPENCTDSLKWVSSNKSVATVSKTGKITAKAKGTAVITAKTGSGIKKSITVTVLKAPKKVSFAKKELSIKQGDSIALAPVFPKGSTGSITYKSSNKSAVSVNKKGVVKAKKSGSATITATTYNGKTASIIIKVK